MHKVDRRLFISDQAVAWPSLKKKVKICFDFVFVYLLIYAFEFAEKIHRLFSRKNYEVRSFTNLNKKEILEIINYYSSKSESGSLICFLSSEGDQTSLACPVKNVTDESSVKILDVLKSANTKELEMRRKIFFIDACRK